MAELLAEPMGFWSVPGSAGEGMGAVGTEAGLVTVGSVCCKGGWGWKSPVSHPATNMSRTRAKRGFGLVT